MKRHVSNVHRNLTAILTAINQLEEVNRGQGQQVIQSSTTSKTKMKRNSPDYSAAVLPATTTSPQMQQPYSFPAAESQPILFEGTLIQGSEVVPQDQVENLLSS